MVEFYRGGAGARDKRNMALKVADIKGCVHFPYLDLKDATKNFDQRPVNKGGCKLGEGGFGPVFKGTLRYTDVAIKGISKRARVSCFCVAKFLNVWLKYVFCRFVIN